MNDMLRITGLASGIDTEEMVRNLMGVERLKVDRVEQDRQVSIWRQEMYNSLNKDFANFIINSRKAFGLTTVSRTGVFLPNSYQNLNWVKKATSSDETKATVSSTGKALDGMYKVEVKQLADGVNLASGQDIRESLKKVESLRFTVNDKEIHIEKDEGQFVTADDVVKAINSKDLGIKASYDKNIGRFFLQTTEVGAEAKIEINADGDGAMFIESLGLTIDDGEEGTLYELGKELVGKNAIINFNGANNIEYDSNRITINDITMELTATGEFNIRVATNVDEIYEKIEKFVNDYNELVEKTNRLLGEEVYRNYRPLTASQKKGMDKEDIELWEEKAKSGLLKNDDIIERTMLSIRRALYEKSDEFSGPFKLITELGITTEEYARGNAGGKLVIDEAKLKDAIAKDPEAVMEFLFKESNPDKEEIGGIVTRVYDNLMKGMEGIIEKSGAGDDRDLLRQAKSNILLDFVTNHGSISLLDKDVMQFNKRIDSLNDILFRKENAYYAKFAAMEKAMSKMNQQSMWLMQQFMG